MKMRLIDKDKLIERCKQAHPQYYKEFIREAEEVDAIPIEWIKEKLNTCEYDWDMDSIWQMIEDWRKENDR